MSFLTIFLGMLTLGLIVVVLITLCWLIIGGVSKLADWLMDNFGAKGEFIFMIVLGGFVVPFIMSVVFWLIGIIGGFV